MSGERSIEKTQHEAAQSLSEQLKPDVEFEKPVIISSTSFFIRDKILENSTELPDTYARNVDVESVIAAIKLEMRNAIITPSSEFPSAERLVENYGESYSLEHLEPDDKLRVASAYIESVELAREEGRYFGRNSTVLDELYKGDEEAAVNGFLEFAEKFGYSLADKTVLTDEGKINPDDAYDVYNRLCRYYKPGEYLVHSSDEGKVSLDESHF